MLGLSPIGNCLKIYFAPSLSNIACIGTSRSLEGPHHSANKIGGKN